MKPRSRQSALPGVVLILLVALVLLVRLQKRRERLTVIERETPTVRELERLGALTAGDYYEEARTGHTLSVIFDRTADVDRGIPLLGNLPKLESVVFVEDKSADAHVRALARVERDNGLQIQLLDFGKCSITSAGLAELKQFSALVTLDLANSEISQDGLRHIGALSGLRHLTLASTTITDEGLAIVANLDELRFLSLRNTNITDEGLKHLTRLQHLENLDISFTHVTDMGVVHLKQLQAVQSLRFSFTAISDAGVVELRASLPNWETESDSRASIFRLENLPGLLIVATICIISICMLLSRFRTNHAVTDHRSELARQEPEQQCETNVLPKQQDWLCQACGVDVPGHFDVCWYCQESKK